MANQVSIEGFRLAPQQAERWALYQESAVYVARCEISIDGFLDVDRLRQAIENVIARHEILRTSYQCLDGVKVPLQVIEADSEFSLAEIDLTGLNSAAQPSRIEQAFKAAGEVRFDLEQTSQLRGTLFKLSPSRHVLLLSLPGICADAITLQNLFREISGAYHSLTAGVESLPKPAQFVQVSDWLNQLLEDEEAGTTPWRNADLPKLAALKLPGQIARDSIAFAPAVLEFQLDPKLVQQVDSLAVRHRCEQPTVLLAAWQVLLWRLTAQLTDGASFAIGLSCDGRRYDEMRGALGLFARSVPLVCRCEEHLSFAELLAQTRDDVARVCAAQEYFVWPVEMQNGSPHFFSVAYEYLEEASPERVNDLVFSLIRQISITEPFKLKLLVHRRQEKLCLEYHYDANAFQPDAVKRLQQHFEAVLANLDSVALGAVSLLDQDLRQELLLSFNQTSAPYPQDKCLHELLAEQAARTPDSIAVVSERESFTFAELDRRANQLAHHLIVLGAGPESRIGVCLDRSLEMIVALLGILKSGGAYVALNPTDPPERLAFMLADADVSMLLTKRDLIAGWPSVVAKVIDVQTDWREISRQRTDQPKSTTVPENLAYMLYTSGSTGTPKGTLITHRGLVNYLHWCSDFYQVAGGDGAPVHTSVVFDLTVTSIFSPLLRGRKILLLPEEPGLDALADALLAQRNLSFVKLTPAHLEILNQQLSEAELAGRSRVLIFGGEALLAESLADWRYKAPDTRLINEYGPTETVVGCCVYEVSEQDAASGPVPIGFPIANTQLYVLDKRGEPAPIGVTGELYIGGEGLARGYHHRPDLTAEKFVPHPFATNVGERLYRTGDLARRRADGVIEFLGRKDDQVKVRGYRIELGEIEAVLRAHESIHEAAVVALADRPGENRLIAYVVMDREGFSTVELRSFLLDKLPDYMVPHVFVRLDKLPLAPSGKVDRRALPASDQNDLESDIKFESPRTLTEEVLAAIWAEVLHLERVGIDDNFFALSGDSIRSIQVRARAQQRGITIAPQQIFQYPTIRELARVVKFADAEPAQPVRTEPFSLITEADRLKLPVGVEDAYPLSLLQAGMLFHSELNPESAIFHDLHSFHLQVPFDRNKLEQAITQLALSHPTLRTSCDLRSYSEPLQLVHSGVRIPLEEEDLRHLNPSEQESAVAAALEVEKQRKFDWEQAPLLRFRVLRRTDDTCQFVLSFHHLILDGWSVATMLTDLFNRYAALLEHGEAPKLDPPSTLYRDFVATERAALNSEEHRQYWSQLLQDVALQRIPRSSSASESNPGAQGNVYQVPISDELSQALRQLARVNSVPVKSVLLAAHLKVMSLLGGTTDVLTALISNGRPEEADGDRMLGLFLNTLPFRLNLSGGAWTDLVKETFEAERKQLPFRRYPLAELQRRQGGGLLFETAFNYMHYHVYQNMTQANNVHLLDYQAFEETNFPLMANFAMEPVTSLIQLHLNYHPEELSYSQIKSIGDYYARSLESLAIEPEQRYENVSPLPVSEQRRMLDEWNRTETEYPREACLAQLIEAQVRKTPQLVAVSDRAGQLTYDQLNRSANQLARLLIEQGVGRETIVPLLMNRRREFVIAMLALFKAGAAYLPLDPLHPPSRLAQIIAGSGAGIILTSGEFMPRLAEALSEVPAGEKVRLFMLEEMLAQERSDDEFDTDLEPRGFPESLAYVIFTSGSTGVPKGVMIEQQGMINHLYAKVGDLKLSAADVVAQTASQCFDISVWQFMAPLLTGGCVSIFDEESILDPAQLVDRVRREKITILEVVPSLLRAVLDELQHGESDPRSFVSLRCLLTTGEALPLDLAREWLEMFPRIPLLNAYGPTECSDDVTHHLIAKAPSAEVTRMPIGKPIANTRLYVLNSHLQPVPPGVSGELLVAGDGVGRGYLHDAKQTAETFIPDPFAKVAGGRLYRTGDLVQYQEDGTIDFLGRRDHQVKVRGFRIELSEIEAGLRSHSQIRDAVVITSEEDGAEKRLIAYVVYATESGTTVQQLRQYLQERLPEYMIPSAFVVLAELPLTATGKVDRKALPNPNSLALEPLEHLYVPPETRDEEVVATIWSEVLRVERVGKTDNFFELGGHSLLATQVISRLRSEFGVEVPLRRIFEAPTVAALALRIAEARNEQQTQSGTRVQTIPRRSRQVIKPRKTRTIDELLAELDQISDVEASETTETANAEASEAHPLSFSQEKIWADVKAKNSFNLPLAMRLTGELNVAIFEQCFREVIKRHEALRSTFGEEDGRAVQFVSETLTLDCLPVTDLELIPAAEREQEIQRVMAAESRREFDLATGPQLRVTLLRLSDREHVALATMPLIISDAWSGGVLMNEFARLYSALAAGQPASLPELPIQLADYAHWERQWLRDEALEQQYAYWGQRLGGELPVLELPTDRPRPSQLSFSGASESLILEADLIEQLRTLARQEGVTMFMLMLAAFNTFLARQADQEDIIVGIPAAGRNWVETEPLIGSFANTLVIRMDLTGRPSFRELLTRVRDVTLEAYARQQMPFVKLLEFLRAQGMKENLPYRVMFDLVVAGQGNAAPGADLPGLQVAIVEEEASTGTLFVGNYLTFVLQEIGPEIIAFLRYKTELFDSSTIAKMLEQIRLMLIEIVADPDKEIKSNVRHLRL